jgi:hypothetical protein
MEDLLLGTIFGGIVGFLSGYYFYLLPKEEKWNEEFIIDKQTLNRFLIKVRFELELLIEQLNEVDVLNRDILYLRRLLNEDPLTLSFGDKNFSSRSLQPVRDAREKVEEIKTYVEKGEFKEFELKRFISDLSKIRMRIVSIKDE